MGDAGTRRRWGSELDATLQSPPGTKRPQVRGILVESLWNPLGPEWLPSPAGGDNFQPCLGRGAGTALTHAGAEVGVSLAQELPGIPTRGHP